MNENHFFLLSNEWKNVNKKKIQLLFIFKSIFMLFIIKSICVICFSNVDIN